MGREEGREVGMAVKGRWEVGRNDEMGREKREGRGKG